VIVYLHGFNSTPGSHKARTLHAYLKARGLDALFASPELPHRPEEAMRAIETTLARVSAQKTTVVGSSLGGFYATYVAEKHGCRAVLLQPAVSPHVGLEAFLGTQQNLHTGERYELTRAHLEAWRALAVERVDPERYLVFLETGDEVLDWREAALKYAGARMVIRDGGDHSLRTFPEHIPRILAFAGIAARA
jgi:predicted esterase YcpF (UPF0227 family)